MPQFQVIVQDRSAREHIISERVLTPDRREPFYQYGPQQGILLPVIHVPIGLPLYRMANWRTRTKQNEHLQREGLHAEYFSHGEENVSVQRVQHQILIEFANRGRGESIISILQKLKQDHRQMEPLLATAAGVLVNGNRRLAAMRELFAEDPGSFPFATLEVKILPATLTSSELQKIEFELQMQQETKLPYDWAIQCLSVRELFHSGVSITEIAQMMRLERNAQVLAMIHRLDEADLYLSEYLAKPGDYVLVEGKEQQFIELQKALDKKSDIHEKELARKMCYVLTKHSRDLETRAYDFKIAFGTKTAQVAEKLAVKTNITLPPPNEVASHDTDDNDLFADHNSALVASRFEPVKQLLSDQERSEELAEMITDICTEIREDENNGRDAKKTLKQICKAKALLQSIDVAEAGNDTLLEVRTELANILQIAESLLEDANDIKSN